jgi:hypothetical protein
MMNTFTFTTEAPRLEATAPDFSTLCAKIDSIESRDAEVLDLAFAIAGAAPEVRAQVQQRCREALAEYEANAVD